MSQTSYNLEMEEAVAGQLAYVSSPYTAISYNNPVDEIRFGTGVQKVSADEDGIERVDSEAGYFAGVAMIDKTVYEGESTVENAYPADDSVAVLKRGPIRVLVDDDVTPDDEVYVRKCDTLEVSTLVLSGAGSGDLVTSNSVAITVDGTAVADSPVVFDTSNAVTLAAVAAAIEAADEVYTAVSDGNHTITITSSNAVMPVVNLTITGGATQATDTQTETVAGVAGTDQGVFRADADGGTAKLVSAARFLSSGSDGDAVILDLNLD